MVDATGQVIYGNNNWKPRDISGVGTGYLIVGNWQIRRGGFFTDRDVTAAAKVCVVGHTIVEKLFQTTDPLGKTIRIKSIPFLIIGVLEKKGANIAGGRRRRRGPGALHHRAEAAAGLQLFRRRFPAGLGPLDRANARRRWKRSSNCSANGTTSTPAQRRRLRLGRLHRV